MAEEVDKENAIRMDFLAKRIGTPDPDLVELLGKKYFEPRPHFVFKTYPEDKFLPDFTFENTPELTSFHANAKRLSPQETLKALEDIKSQLDSDAKLREDRERELTAFAVIISEVETLYENQDLLIAAKKRDAQRRYDEEECWRLAAETEIISKQNEALKLRNTISKECDEDVKKLGINGLERLKKYTEGFDSLLEMQIPKSAIMKVLERNRSSIVNKETGVLSVESFFTFYDQLK